MLQSVHFSRDLFILEETKNFLWFHGLVPMKPVHITKNFYEYRINPPIKGHYYSKYVVPGVLLTFVK